MSHILVKWATAEAWDVYPTRKITDVATATEIMTDPTVVETLAGRTFMVTWKDKEPPAEAYIIAAGELSKMERRRNRLAARASTQASQQVNCCNHVDQVKDLQKRNEDLERKVAEQQDMIDLQRTVRTLKRIVRNIKSPGESTTREPTMVNIGK
ncbi:uncharacterized protein LOC135397940 isoform X1 [Ornithodoros turicata]|uniref:uncharacterized protein LOC135397940 isoform X1 n=1 Tax=Ornithodoros turicata TaxID=34597 RepID=UPI0031392437